MTERATLRMLLDNLGTGIVQTLVSPAGLDVAAGHPVIDDPADAPDIDADDVVLAVGTPVTSAGALALVDRAGACGAAAVVFRGEAAAPVALAQAAERAGMALLGVVPEMAWSQLHTLLRSTLAISGEARPEAIGGGPIGDLFSLANAIAAMVGGPATIEDPQSTVLAYSSLDEPVDEGRRQTILGRRVPEEWRRRLQEDGVFRRLWSQPGVLRVDYPDAVPPLRPRLAVGVRAGGEVLGSIWVAENASALDQRAEQALAEAAPIAALHLIRARSGEDLERARRSSLLRAVLEGRSTPDVLAESLRAGIDAFVTVVGFRLRSEAPEELAMRALRAGKVLDLYCESMRRKGTSVAIGPVVYLLLVDESEPLRARIGALAGEMVDRAGEALPDGTSAGIGSTHRGLAGISASRQEADQVLAVLAGIEHGGTTSPGDRRGRRVAGIEDVRSRTILLRLRELAAREPALLQGRLGALADHDRERHSDYLGTLRAFLDAFGDVPMAAAASDVHPNTFRYRLRRLTEVAGLDLDDPIERLVVHLQLHLGS